MSLRCDECGEEFDTSDILEELREKNVDLEISDCKYNIFTVRKPGSNNL